GYSFHLIRSLHRWPPPRSPLFPYTTLFRSQPGVIPEATFQKARQGNRVVRYLGIGPQSWRHEAPVQIGTNGKADGAYLNWRFVRSEEHTSELQLRENLVCRLLLEKKKT